MALSLVQSCDAQNYSTGQSKRVEILETFPENEIKEKFILKDNESIFQYIKVDGMYCLRWTAYSKGGISCNWNMFRQHKTGIREEINPFKLP
jgi:hypothetical protein